MGDLVVDKPNRTDAYWVTYIKNRIAKKKNFLGIITGPTGSGKSWSGLSICYQVDPTFKPERIVYKIEQLMKLINENKVESGQAILWDEVGVDLSSRNWQGLINKLINFLLQTFRNKRIILIMTCPYTDFVDANTRKLFHAEFLTQSIDYQNKKVKTKPHIIQYNPRSRKFYYKFLRIRTKLGVAPLKYWNIPKSPDWLIDAYEETKTKFTNALNKDIERQVKQFRTDKEGVDKRKELTEKQKL
jgi:hypothetical protein